MITCPICQKEVLEIYTSGERSRVLQQIPEESGQDFNCPTLVQTNDIFLEPHYGRRTNQGCHPEYIALVMPFSVIWTEGRNKIEVTLWHVPPVSGEICYQGEGDYQEFIKIAKKFNNLRAFA